MLREQPRGQAVRGHACDPCNENDGDLRNELASDENDERRHAAPSTRTRSTSWTVWAGFDGQAREAVTQATKSAKTDRKRDVGSGGVGRR